MKADLKATATSSRSIQSRQDLGLVCLFGSVFLYVFSRTLADPDLWGHMKFGQDLWRSGTIVREDIYSYLTGDQLWINHEWLAEALFYAAYAVGGTPGLVGFKTFISLLITGIIYRHLRREIPDTLRAGILAIVFSLVLIPYLATVRPQAFTFLIFLVILIFLQKADRGQIRWLWFVPPLLALGVNLHGGFLAGLGIFVLWALVYLSSIAFRERDLAAPFSRSHLLVAFIAIAGILATLANPYGPDLPLFLLRTATVARPEIGEWGPATLTSFQGRMYVVLLGLALAGLIFSSRKHSPALLILFICTAVLPLIASRHVPLFAIAVTVIAGEHIGDAWKQWLPARSSSTHEVSPRSWQSVLCFVTAVFLVSISVFNFGCVRIDQRASAVPARAIALLKQANVSENLAIHFDWGEYAVWHLGPRVKVSVDGRRETVYSSKIYTENLNFMNGIGDWEAILRNYDTELALVSKNFSVFNLMTLRSDWVLVYDDPAAGLFVRKGSPAIEGIRNTKIPDVPYDGAGLCFP